MRSVNGFFEERDDEELGDEREWERKEKENLKKKNFVFILLSLFKYEALVKILKVLWIF